jgi:hypothetical protein
LKQAWQRLPGLDGDDTTLALANSSLSQSDTVHVSGDNHKALLSSQPFEAFVLDRAGLNSRLKEAGFVEVKDKKIDTLAYIRKGVMGSAKLAKRPKASRSQSRSTTTTTPSASAPWHKDNIPSANSDPSNIKEKHAALVNRTLVRLLLKLPGVTIKHFRDKMELLKGFRDALIRK